MLGLIRTAITGGNACKLLWTATTGKAALRLAEVANVPTRTLHGLLYWPPKERPDHLAFTTVRPFPGNAGDVIVVDEASMITKEIRDTIESEWVQNGARILYVGDGYQLPPVGDDFSIFYETEGPKLREVYRNGGDILQAATHLRETGRILTESRGAYTFRGGDLRSAVGDYLADPRDHALITWRNKVRMQANMMIRTAKGLRSPTPAPGEPVLYCKNGQGVINGETAIVDAIAPDELLGKVQTHLLVDAEGHSRLVSITGREAPMDGYLPALETEEYRRFTDDIKSLSWAQKRKTGEYGDFRPVPITWAYCLTAHKAQGSEFDRATVYLTNWDSSSKPFREMTMLPDGTKMSFAARWCYTALTRAKKRVSVVIGG
jgi:hypothetical protein